MFKFKKYGKKFFSHTHFNELSVFGRDQHFDWKILLGFFLLLIITAATFSIHVFLGVRAGDIFQSDNKAPTHNTNINKQALDTVINTFAVRATDLQALQTQKPVFVDPSL